MNILAGTLGLAWSSATLAIAGACGRKYGADTDGPRAVTGLGLGLLALICENRRTCTSLASLPDKCRRLCSKLFAPLEYRFSDCSVLSYICFNG